MATEQQRYVAAIDQGTTSTRMIVFDRAGAAVCSDQREHRQIYPRPGWVEHDPEEIWARTEEVARGALERGGLGRDDLAAVGITNQRETTVVWDRATGVTTFPRCVADVRARKPRTARALGDSITASKIRFSATLFRPVATAKAVAWTFLTLPKEASAKLPSRGMTSVEGTFNGLAYRGTLEPDGRIPRRSLLPAIRGPSKTGA